MFPEHRTPNGEEIRNPLAEAIEKVCPVYSEASPATDATALKDSKECLLNVLHIRHDVAVYPRAKKLALHNKYIANHPIQLVFVTPEEAAADEAVKHTDYARAFESLDSEHYFSADNAGHTMLFPAGTKLTPVLDRLESALGRAAGSTTVRDERSVIEHTVKGVIGRDLPVPYSSAPSLRSGNAAFLVQIEDGRFAMVMGGAMLNVQMAEPYKFEKAQVPLSVQPRAFQGTVDEFAAAFPGYLERAASAAGLNPGNYGRVAAYLIDVVKTCDGITPEMAQSTASQFPGHMEDLRKLGKQYTPCQLTMAAIPQDVKQGLERDVIASITPIGGRGWADRQWLSVVVQFTPLPGDSRIRGANGFAALFANYGIVSAKITKVQ
jgi:hypothetical protein